jgi:hypothetical protein
MVFFENMILFYKYYLNVQSKQEYRLEKEIIVYYIIILQDTVIVYASL